MHSFLHDEAGATAIEYGLIAALLITTLIVGLTALGGSISNLYDWAGMVVEAIT